MCRSISKALWRLLSMCKGCYFGSKTQQRYQLYVSEVSAYMHLHPSQYPNMLVMHPVQPIKLFLTLDIACA